MLDVRNTNERKHTVSSIRNRKEDKWIFLDKFDENKEKHNTDRCTEKTGGDLYGDSVICKNCGGYIVRTDEFDLVCTECGLCSPDNIVSDTKYMKFDDYTKSFYKGYDRMMNFNKKFRFLEARQKVIIPNSVLDLFRNKINIEEDIIKTRNFIRMILYQAGLSKKYYRHDWLIVYLLTGKRIEFTQEFKSESFNIYRHAQQRKIEKNKKKMVPWNHCMINICKMIPRYNHYEKYFDRLKIKKNIKRNDLIWKKCIEDLEKKNYRFVLLHR